MSTHDSFIINAAPMGKVAIMAQRAGNIHLSVVDGIEQVTVIEPKIVIHDIEYTLSVEEQSFQDKRMYDIVVAHALGSSMSFGAYNMDVSNNAPLKLA